MYRKRKWSRGPYTKAEEKFHTDRERQVLESPAVGAGYIIAGKKYTIKSFTDTSVSWSTEDSEGVSSLDFWNEKVRYNLEN